MRAEVIRILDRSGRLSKPAGRLDGRSDLYAQGLSSLATVEVMLAIEEAFSVEFPNALLRRSSFESLDAIERVVAGLVARRDGIGATM